jgi:hypothetical protein
MTPNTSRSKRIRVTLPAQENGYLHWLAVESGNDESTEAALLLRMGIRLAIRRYRRLYGGRPIDGADAETLERETPGEPGYQTGQPWQLEHSGGVAPVDDTTRFDPPLVLPEWEPQGSHSPHRERGFAGHGEKEEE